MVHIGSLHFAVKLALRLQPCRRNGIFELDQHHRLCRLAVPEHECIDSSYLEVFVGYLGHLPSILLCQDRVLEEVLVPGVNGQLTHLTEGVGVGHAFDRSLILSSKSLVPLLN